MDDREMRRKIEFELERFDHRRALRKARLRLGAATLATAVGVSGKAFTGCLPFESLYGVEPLYSAEIEDAGGVDATDTDASYDAALSDIVSLYAAQDAGSIDLAENTLYGFMDAGEPPADAGDIDVGENTLYGFMDAGEAPADAGDIDIGEVVRYGVWDAGDIDVGESTLYGFVDAGEPATDAGDIDIGEVVRYGVWDAGD